MKVKWEQFAQRRKINLEMFKSMSYIDYTGWCNFRRVEPVSKDAYEGVQRMVTKNQVQVPENIVTVSAHEFNELHLKKLRKSALIKLCEDMNLLIEFNETKRQLIEKLLSLNK
jgi:hypothetical protein